jgi:hypothetical protein
MQGWPQGFAKPPFENNIAEPSRRQALSDNSGTSWYPNPEARG